MKTERNATRGCIYSREEVVAGAARGRGATTKTKLNQRKETRNKHVNTEHTKKKNRQGAQNRCALATEDDNDSFLERRNNARDSEKQQQHEGENGRGTGR